MTKNALSVYLKVSPEINRAGVSATVEPDPEKRQRRWANQAENREAESQVLRTSRKLLRNRAT